MYGPSKILLTFIIGFHGSLELGCAIFKTKEKEQHKMMPLHINRVTAYLKSFQRSYHCLLSVNAPWMSKNVQIKWEIIGKKMLARCWHARICHIVYEITQIFRIFISLQVILLNIMSPNVKQKTWIKLKIWISYRGLYFEQLSILWDTFFLSLTNALNVQSVICYKPSVEI